MSKSRHRWIIFIGWPLALFAAGVAGACGAAPEPEPERKEGQAPALLGFAGDVLFSLSLAVPDGWSTPAPPLALTLTTEDVFPCAGYRLRANPWVGNDTVRVEILGVEGPGGVCPTSIEPARFHTTLTVTPGEYTLLIDYIYEDRYHLLVTRTGARVTPVETHFTHLQE
jgi:hypothetical protein